MRTSAHGRNIVRNIEQQILAARHRRIESQKEKTLSSERTSIDDLIDAATPHIRNFFRGVERGVDRATDKIAEAVVPLLERAEQAAEPHLKVVRDTPEETVAETDGVRENPRCKHCGRSIGWTRSTVPGHGHWYHKDSLAATCSTIPKQAQGNFRVSVNVTKVLTAPNSQEATDVVFAQLRELGFDVKDAR